MVVEMWSHDLEAQPLYWAARLVADTRPTLASPHATLDPKQAFGEEHIATRHGPETDDNPQAAEKTSVNHALGDGLAESVAHHQPSINGDELLSRGRNSGGFSW